MKAIAFYLPQYHTIPENDAAWGRGFTEWTNVKKSIPVIKSQVQPKVPLNNNYYCLLDDDVKIWQVEMAKRSGIYGFCYYHYWFNGKLLLEKPAEQMLKNRSIEMPFCFSWANEPWSKRWKGEAKNVIMEQRYGDEEDWKRHFEYLLPFFRDDRYIKHNDMPMMIVYKPDIIPNCNEMLKYWADLAKKNGFKGIYIGCQFPSSFRYPENEKLFDFAIEFEPLYTRTEELYFLNLSTNIGIISLLKSDPVLFIKILHQKIRTKLNRPTIFDYEKTCKQIITRKPKFKNAAPGFFTAWDKTPRNGAKATVYIGSTPEKYESYLRQRIVSAQQRYKSDYIFITAWNEWGEGAYLEPDVEFCYGYIDATARALAVAQYQEDAR